jgi:hypothetical protein
MYKRMCNVCGKVTDELQVCNSALGAFSLSYCNDCYEKGLEPYQLIVSSTAEIGHFPEDINQEYQEYIKNMLKGLDIPEEQFINDVDNFIIETENPDNGW